MSWVAVGGAAVGVIGSQLQGSGGGAGSSSATKEPWAPAAPWMMNNINAGQVLQQQMTDRPFSDQQMAAYQNQDQLSDFMRQLTPNLLSQISGQSTGFDRTKPNAKPKGLNFDGLLSDGSSAGLLSMLNGPSVARPPSYAPPPKPAPAPLPPAVMSYFQGYNGDYISPNAPGGGS